MKNVSVAKNMSWSKKWVLYETKLTIRVDSKNLEENFSPNLNYLYNYTA